jgi:glycosyltransferase involved in cell wall biosynthesis
MDGDVASRPAWTYDVVGYHGGDFGLAVAAAQTVTSLRGSGRAVRPIPLESRPPPPIRDRLARALRPGRHDGPGRSVALFQVNPLEIAQHAFQWQADVATGARNVCVPFWELPVVPRSWEAILSGMDAILAPTRFIQEACARVVDPERVLHYPQSVTLPPGIAPSREAWGLSPSATVFLVSFDVGSGIDRKNPWAAIEAFRRAFPGSEDVQLVIKTRPWDQVREFAGQLERLREATAGDPRVRIVERSLPYADVMRLYASCDVLVALHRSEGLGLHLMEAMSLGRAVVATGWSGNADFMTGANSVPVPFALVPIDPLHPHYRLERSRPGQVWAEPDVDAAARSLRRLRAEPSLREALGRQAARDMEDRRVASARAATFATLEERLARSRPRSLGPAVWRTRWRLTFRGWRALAGL